MVLSRKPDDEVPQYDPNDLENYFSFRVHHGGEFDSKMVNYIGGSECFYDYVSLDELSMLDIEDIAIELGYDLPMVYFIQLPGYGKPFILDSDKDLLWFQDRIPVNRVVDLYIQHVLPLNVVTGKELVCDGRDEGVYDGPDEVGIGLLDKGVFDINAEVGTSIPGEGVFDGHDEGGTGMPGEGVFDRHDEGGTGMPREAVCDGLDEVGNDRPDEGVCDGPDKVGDLHDEVGNGRPNEGVRDGPDEVTDMHDESLDDFADDQVERGQPSNFINKRYHEFDLVRDMANPIFKIGMEFATADVFRKAIRVHAIKHRRNIKFQKNDPNRVKAVYKDKGCNWFVFASWLGDQKTFKIKSMVDAHSCAMSFKNTFVNSKMIADKYVGQWRENPEWNYAGMSQQLRTDTNVDASIWQYYRARTRAKELIQGSRGGMVPVRFRFRFRDSWEWFLELLGQDLEINNSYGIVWITDKQKGLIDAIAQMFPNSEHRFCVRHMYNNFKSEHKGLLFKQILWAAAKCTTEQGFAQAMEKMRSESVAAYE
ncbi:hypothetical protein Q3G72_032472 [Acer saccharum]|nr:hypothetical protein Q3G72_032472 [Acer saccharum]